MNFLNWLEAGGLFVFVYGALAFFYVRHRSLEMMRTSSEINPLEESKKS
jgi:hypothetical protein